MLIYVETFYVEFYEYNLNFLPTSLKFPCNFHENFDDFFSNIFNGFPSNHSNLLTKSFNFKPLNSKNPQVTRLVLKCFHLSITTSNSIASSKENVPPPRALYKTMRSGNKIRSQKSLNRQKIVIHQNRL